MFASPGAAYAALLKSPQSILHCTECIFDFSLGRHCVSNLKGAAILPQSRLTALRRTAVCLVLHVLTASSQMRSGTVVSVHDAGLAGQYCWNKPTSTLAQAALITSTLAPLHKPLLLQRPEQAVLIAFDGPVEL